MIPLLIGSFSSLWQLDVTSLSYVCVLLMSIQKEEKSLSLAAGTKNCHNTGTCLRSQTPSESTMSKDKTSKRGRPTLTEDERGHKVSYYFTRELLEKIKERSHALGTTDSFVIRSVLDEHVENFRRGGKDSERVVVGLDDQLGRGIVLASDLYGIDPHAVVRTLLFKALPDFLKEGKKKRAELEEQQGQS